MKCAVSAFVVVALVGGILALWLSLSTNQATPEANEQEEAVTLEFWRWSSDDELYLKPVVQFSCGITPTRKEDALEVDLAGTDDTKKLSALATLLGLWAPSSVPLQYAAYRQIRNKYPDHKAVKLAARAFDRGRIKSVISRAPSTDRYERPDDEYSWAIRAIGVLKMEECLPRLLELSKAENLYTHLAAERSIEDFDGPLAEDALLKVIELWQYDAYIRAAGELTKRNPEKFARALEKMTPPDANRFFYGLFLARCGNPKGVPILCQTVKRVAIIDREAFDLIAALALPEHKGIISDLPKNCREEQKTRAEECVKRYLMRMAHSENT